MAKGIIDSNGKKVEFETSAPSENKRGGFFAKLVEKTENMTEVLLGKDGKGYVNTITKSEIDQAIDEIKPYWKLIKKIKLEEAVNSIAINNNDDADINKYNRLKFIFTSINVTKTTTVFVHLLDSASTLFNFVGATNVESDTRLRIEIPIINKEYLYQEALTRKGSNTAVITSLVRETQAPESDCILNKIRILSDFDAGTEVYVYGGIEE